MNWKEFFIGIGFLIAACLVYRMIRKGPASEKNNWEGITFALYIQGWGSIVLCVLVGIVFIFKSLPI